jgi:phenylacetate-CoA ligase
MIGMGGIPRILRWWSPAGTQRQGERAAEPRWDLKSAVPGAAWPVVPSASAATVLAVLYQLERSQWLPAERLRAHQIGQLELLVRHAFASVPYYRRAWTGRYDPDVPLTSERFAGLPLLTRGELQTRFDELKSRDVPAAHGAPSEQRTSGATGVPVRFLVTPLTGLFWDAVTLRDHRWHRRDLRGKLAAIRYGSDTVEQASWGPTTDRLVTTGPAVTMTVEADVAQQLDWLEAQQPDYLLTYPSLVAELALLSLRRGRRLPALREVRTLGEMVAPDVRQLCRDAWNVPLTDMYSASETGYLALQCPEQPAHYHVQSEGVWLEVLDDDGGPCAPGRSGRVVVTTLHSFAMPLVRYDIGDYAELGEACGCGRGLPVLRRILGRSRNTLVTASGERHWPAIGQRQLLDIAPIVQHQFVQKAFDLLEARLVTATPLAPETEQRLRRHIADRLPSGVRVQLTYCDRIERHASGKFEEFVSEVTLPAS